MRRSPSTAHSGRNSVARSRAATPCSRPAPRRRSGSGTASGSPPTGRSQRPRNSWADTTWSRRAISTRRSPWPRRSRGRGTGRSRSGPSRISTERRLSGATEAAEACRAEWGRLLSALIRDFDDFDLAEEALQGAFASALTSWKKDLPANPRGWLYAAARHDAIDRLRREARLAGKRAEMAAVPDATAPSADLLYEENAVPDERLRLIFTCFHPALAPEAQVALTLRTLCGLGTEEIARAFLVPAPTMAQRLVRAKTKIRTAGIPYVVPEAADLPERLSEVMAVLYLVFNEGYSASSGQVLVRGDLCTEAIRLARLVRELLQEPVAELEGLLALMLLHDSRRKARVDAAGGMVLLADQDRSLWDGAEIEEGR